MNFPRAIQFHFYFMYNFFIRKLYVNFMKRNFKTARFAHYYIILLYYVIIFETNISRETEFAIYTKWKPRYYL